MIKSSNFPYFQFTLPKFLVYLMTCYYELNVKPERFSAPSIFNTQGYLKLVVKAKMPDLPALPELDQTLATTTTPIPGNGLMSMVLISCCLIMLSSHLLAYPKLQFTFISSPDLANMVIRTKWSERIILNSLIFGKI